MKMSSRGREALKKREGNVLRAYRCSAGVWTIGCGHTSAAGNPVVHPDLVITEAESDAILSKDLVLYERAIDNALKVPVSQNEYDALVSVCFNVGPRFAQSTCIKQLNAGDRVRAAEAIMLWNKPAEIIGRRRTEYNQFKTPYQGMVQPKKPSKTTGPVVAGTAGAGAGAAAQQAGLPMWAVGLIVVGVAVAVYVAWRLRK